MRTENHDNNTLMHFFYAKRKRSTDIKKVVVSHEQIKPVNTYF